MDTGDFIVVVNVDKLRVTGNKARDKKYYRHSDCRAVSTKPTSPKLQQRFPSVCSRRR